MYVWRTTALRLLGGMTSTILWPEPTPEGIVGSVSWNDSRFKVGILGVPSGRWCLSLPAASENDANALKDPKRGQFARRIRRVSAEVLEGRGVGPYQSSRLGGEARHGIQLLNSKFTNVPTSCASTRFTPSKSPLQTKSPEK